MMKILSADHVLPISSEPIGRGAVAIEGDRIVAVGEYSEIAPRFPGAAQEEFGEAVLMPGLVNCHSHLELTVMRGFLDELDEDFYAWLIRLTTTRVEKLTEKDIFLSAAFGALEAARAGVTCIGDIGWSGQAGLEALKINGLRGILFQETKFSPDDRTAEDDFETLKQKFLALREKQTDLVTAGISPHAPYTVSRALFEKISDIAEMENIPITIHAAESPGEDEFLKTGRGFFAGIYEKSGLKWSAPAMSPVEYLESIGVLRIAPLLAHCVTVSDCDIDLIRESGSKIAHCPKSNAKFGHGVAPYDEFLAKGVSVGFGSDSMASNNTCDIFEEARFAALLSRTQEIGKPFPAAKQIIETATLGGARALSLDSVIGSLETGKQADIIAVGLDAAAQIPVHEIYSTLLFATNARDVRMTMVAGEEIFREGIAKKLDENDLKARVREIAGRMNRTEPLDGAIG